MLRITEDEINDKLEMINQQFNKLFFLKDQRYRFEILLETNKIEFTISIGQLPLQLDRQSTGFRWFFNFFFTVIEQKNLQRGDIVVMDEPATNLHVSGIQELRSFIKKYAAESELTFVISTHSPFFIDPDYLEEIRVVSREEKHAVIDSKFHAIQPEDSDALAPVKSALTVGRHILLNPNNKTIFVEGITDYCYLTAMKKILNIGSGLYFVPIQGLLKESLLESIMKIDKYPTILVDSDNIGKGVAKRAMMNEYVNKVQIIKLSDVNPDHREIEDLFDKEDRPNEKTFLAAVTFKNNCNSQNLSPVTLKNFSALIRKLES
jgi:energy-coupling factor transporter ATP-binding protein EcfA2